MKKIKVQCPAKINLDLKVVEKRSDGFHNIESVMQTINLFDYLTIAIEESLGAKSSIILSGNNSQIPYDNRNLVYKAIELYLAKSGLSFFKICVNIEKHIPVCAGLGGGSTDAAGVLYGLNYIFNKFGSDGLNELCASLGSDLNVCLAGGRILARGRGEILSSLPFEDFKLSIIKPNNLGISAKDAYLKFSYKKENSIDLQSRSSFKNDLEWAVFDDYSELQYIKSKYPNSVMTGSGSAYYILNDKFQEESGYEVINNLCSVPYGVMVV